QRPQPFGDLLARHALPQPLNRDLEPATEVDERVAGDDRAPTLDPEHEVVVLPSGKRVDPERKPIARRVQMRLAAVPGQEPGDLGTAAVGWRHEHRRAEAFDQALR